MGNELHAFGYNPHIKTFSKLFRNISLSSIQKWSQKYLPVGILVRELSLTLSGPGSFWAPTSGGGPLGPPLSKITLGHPFWTKLGTITKFSANFQKNSYDTIWIICDVINWWRHFWWRHQWRHLPILPYSTPQNDVTMSDLDKIWPNPRIVSM